MPDFIKLHAVGDFACFTRPEMKAERVSYDIITPISALAISRRTALGLTKAIPFPTPSQGFVNPYLADQTGFSDADLELIFTALENAFQFDQSAARPAGSMNPRALIIFEHPNQLGKAHSHKLLEGVTVEKKTEIQVPRSFTHYKVEIPDDLRQFCKVNDIKIIERI
jgi:CRISPR-associated Cas5-like protein